MSFQQLFLELIRTMHFRTCWSTGSLRNITLICSVRLSTSLRRNRFHWIENFYFYATNWEEFPAHFCVTKVIWRVLRNFRWWRQSGGGTVIVNLSTATATSLVWTYERFCELIDLYEERALNTKHNRDLRRKAVTEIAKALDSLGMHTYTRQQHSRVESIFLCRQWSW